MLIDSYNMFFTPIKKKKKWKPETDVIDTVKNWILQIKKKKRIALCVDVR